ncbi:tetratricopeptide repeat protein [Rhodopirellula sp. MGV]|uniref:tetratricopeptide repeat protein n=1 Tax=Rhodopirellula sp. MGV TaxID=2023130 RepID=UPI000B96BA1B|nr:tetratricopeptide repeat protein [Rhodopirellula sp. MGV]OYP32340.1 hypothetical protein CGZ80_19945 [Rhodopirellula sp. MGV]PNY35877.1 hypothetical protein C2E31_15540 [Rhodopirellula baltica]
MFALYHQQLTETHLQQSLGCLPPCKGSAVKQRHKDCCAIVKPTARLASYGLALLLISGLLPLPCQIGELRADEATTESASTPDSPTKLNIRDAISEVRRLRQQGDLSESVERLRQVDDYVTEHHPGQLQLAADYVLLARAATSKLPQETVDQLFASAAYWLSQEETPQPTLQQRIILVTAIATHQSTRGLLDEAKRSLLDIFDSLQSADPSNASELPTEGFVNLTMQTAWQAMTSGNSNTAIELYQSLLDTIDAELLSLPADQLALVRLGFAWATALDPEQKQIAADRLAEFTSLYPDHRDAAKASGLRIRCLLAANNADELVTACEKHFHDFPDAPETPSLVIELASLDTPLAPAIHDWLVSGKSAEQWPAALIATALAKFGSEFAPADFDQLVTQLTAKDRAGTWTAQVLENCDANDQSAISELIAAAVIGGRIAEATELSIESAARWAGRTSRWSMLLHAAENIDLQDDFAGRTVHVDRLFAEAIYLSGQQSKALAYWKHVVDTRGADDFATLLRCAECAVLADETEEADRRLEPIRQRITEAGEHAATERPLVELLEADLAIRKLQFDKARTRLESVVRAPDSPPNLRARAQWMIGETHLLQENFTEAIDAYRMVEGLDPGGPYHAAALVQAGKAFEQLGRTRQASVCYGTLLERFADSKYASEARHRLSSLPTHTPSRTRR